MKDQLEKFECKTCKRQIQSYVSQETGHEEVSGIIEFCRDCRDYRSFKRLGIKVTSENSISAQKECFWGVSKTVYKKESE